MTAIIDVGGGNRAAFASGVFDCLLEKGVLADLCIGVSAGAANCCSYVSGQVGRNIKFYTGYNFSPRAIVPIAWLRTGGSLVDLDYIYGTLSNRDGKCPLDIESYLASPVDAVFVATDADTGEAVYFPKSELSADSYGAICASSAMPGACRPYSYRGRRYFDGYLSDPLPIEKALELGADRIVVLLTLPKDHFRSGKADAAAAREMSKYPQAAKLQAGYAQLYNSKLRKALQLEEEGRAMLLFPEGNHIASLEKNRKKIQALYREGTEKGLMAADFLK